MELQTITLGNRVTHNHPWEWSYTQSPLGMELDTITIGIISYTQSPTGAELHTVTLGSIIYT